MLRDMRGAAVVVGAALIALAAAPALPACGDAFEAPCRVDARAVAIEARATSSRVGPIALAEGADGDVIAAWPSRRGNADAGAAGGDELEAPGMSVVVLGAGGERRLEHVFAPPSALRARRGSTEAVAASFTGDAALFHWREVATDTAADGSTTSRAALRLQRMGLDGREGAVIVDPELTCSRCVLDAVFATIGSTTAALVSEIDDGAPRGGGASADAGGASADAGGASADAGGASADAGGASADAGGASADADGGTGAGTATPPPAPPRVRLVTFDAEGRRLASVELGDLVALGRRAEVPSGGAGAGGAAAGGAGAGAGGGAGGGVGVRPSPGGGLGGGSPAPAMRLAVQRGSFVVRIERAAAVFDAALALRAGPYALPTTEAEIDFELPSGAVSVVWSEGARAVGDVRGYVGDRPDLYVEARDAAGRSTTAPRRITTSITALDVKRSEDRTGVLHTTGPGPTAMAGAAPEPELWLTLVDARGMKVGGDHPVARPTGGSPGEEAPPALPAPGGAGGIGGTRGGSRAGVEQRVATSLLASADRTRFVVWAAREAVVREAVTCDP